jgi:hypothetical protein
MRTPLILACVVEAATGIALLVQPAMVARLLFAADIPGAGVIAGRVAGISLLSLGFACWPGKEPTRAALCGISTYNVLVTLYLLLLGIGGAWVGPLLWPVIVVHAILSLLLGRMWVSASSANAPSPSRRHQSL